MGIKWVVTYTWKSEHSGDELKVDEPMWVSRRGQVGERGLIK